MSLGPTYRGKDNPRKEMEFQKMRLRAIRAHQSGRHLPALLKFVMAVICCGLALVIAFKYFGL